MLTEHSSEPGVSQSVLVIAGGYDKRLAENREHYEELVALIAECGLQSKVSTLRWHVPHLNADIGRDLISIFCPAQKVGVMSWPGSATIRPETCMHVSVCFMMGILFACKSM